MYVVSDTNPAEPEVNTNDVADSVATNGDVVLLNDAAFAFAAENTTPGVVELKGTLYVTVMMIPPDAQPLPLVIETCILQSVLPAATLIVGPVHAPIPPTAVGRLAAVVTMCRTVKSC